MLMKSRESLPFVVSYYRGWPIGTESHGLTSLRTSFSNTTHGKDIFNFEKLRFSGKDRQPLTILSLIKLRKIWKLPHILCHTNILHCVSSLQSLHSCHTNTQRCCVLELELLVFC